MRTMLNRHIPLDAIVRWWYIIVAFPVTAWIFALVVGPDLFGPLARARARPRIDIDAGDFVTNDVWKDELLFTVLGLLLACGVVWLLEEIRENRRRGRSL